MWVHTGAFALAALGMTMITISLPLALALYAPFVPFFTGSRFLVLYQRVGADDIFVFVDGWRQSGRMIVPKTDDAHGRRAVLVRRMTFTYRRTASAVVNTRFTTASAFFGTAVSPVMPIAAFGVFAAPSDRDELRARLHVVARRRPRPRNLVWARARLRLLLPVRAAAEGRGRLRRDDRVGR